MLTARDPKGNVLFHGPVDSAEERAKLPAEVCGRFENLEKQDLPPVPPSPEIAPQPPDENESARLQNRQMERASLSPNNRSGWVRSTVLVVGESFVGT